MMFFITKLASAFLLPPGLFVLLLALALVLLRLRKKKAAAALLTAVAAFLYLLSIEPVKDALILPLEKTFPPLRAGAVGEAEMIVILGGGVIASSPEAGGRSAPSPATLKRVHYGALLYRLYGLPVLVSGGRSRRNSESEARVAARTLREMGVPASAIFEEGTSRNTYENAAAVRQVFAPARVILVTSAYHMPRSILAFRRQSITCLAAPTDYRSHRGGYRVYSFIPSMNELDGSYRALKEYCGLLIYRIRRGA